MKNLLFILISLLCLACNKESGGSVAANELNPLLYGGTWLQEYEYCPPPNTGNPCVMKDEEISFIGNVMTVTSYDSGTRNLFTPAEDWAIDPINSTTVLLSTTGFVGRFSYTVTATTLSFCDSDNACENYTR